MFSFMSDILENPELHNKLSALGKALVNQELAQVAIPPKSHQMASGLVEAT